MARLTGRPTGRPKGSGVIPLWIRLLEKIRFRSSGCWEWTASTTVSPWGEYGVCWDGQKLQRAHRLTFNTFREALPSHLHIDHLVCKNTLCVNPWHLDAVTKKVNTLRGRSPAANHARQTECFRGHPFDEENTCWVKGRHGPQRQCRVCKNLYQRRLRASRKACAA